MKIPFRTLWARYRLICLAFLVTTLIALIFALRFILSVFYWHNPENRSVELQSWMTLGHVTMVYDIPAEELYEALELSPTASGRLKLRQIARSKGVSIKELKHQIERALKEHEDAEKAEDD